MKIGLVILAFYIGFISCFPCQDEAFALSFESHATIQAHEDSHAEALMGDFCSPFCICACCSCVSIPPVVTALPPLAKSVSTDQLVFRYVHSFGQTGHTLIWQPPRQV
ncbi:DUF6660 family protein [Dyadobacter helix]|uniref:DUF6660 family protein n=1 Tax=Dyadobacter helix TaxID=2822344 RepID=UPI001BFC2C85|nr:DUF6660 family protein [Dyadobacter sp. CECT 9275]